MPTRDQVNAYRYRGDDRGHYESYFQRANHPSRPLAFWIRYTVFVPKGALERAMGELWAIFFDGETREIRSVKQEVPLATCQLSTQGLSVSIAGARLDARALEGSARTRDDEIRWSLNYRSPEPPLLLLPEAMYDAPFPRAKALVGSPLAVFDGLLSVNERTITVDGWVGSQNHNWGAKHTDRYAWGQVAGFDDAPSTFFECATATLKLGPLFTPPMSPLVLRHAGEEHRFNSIVQTVRARANYRYFAWQLASRTRHAAVEAILHAPAHAFVALRYGNPPGGHKTCLNSKLAACELVLTRRGKGKVVLKTAHRAAFEILTDDERHGLPTLET